MIQREIYQADLGGIFSKQPVVIISGPSMNEFSDSVIVCPLVSPPQKYPGAVMVKKASENYLQEDGEILPFQIRALPKSTLKKRLGEITEEQLKTLLKNLGEVLFY